MASVGVVGLTVMLGHRYWLWVLHFMCETTPLGFPANDHMAQVFSRAFDGSDRLKLQPLQIAWRWRDP
jgi:hypothetical protein